jgi:orc1/cdc6 family replication initiation protein
VLVEDARVLQDEFIPSEIAHRDAETSHLSAALEPITRGQPAETAGLFGQSGVGKTCVARFTVNQLREQVIDIDTQYVNCWEDYSRFKALYRILDGVESTVDIHRKSTPTDELLERLRARGGEPYVVILDEVDQLEDHDLLYDLHRVRGLEMVLIANSEQELFMRLDDRIQSRLSGAERIKFSLYSLDELVTILRDRVRWGLADGAIGDDELTRIADAAAGDARAAIGILRAAARQAQQDGLDTITMDVVEDAIPEAKTEMRQADLDRLNPDQRALYDIINDAGEIGPGDLYEQYQNQVEDPKSKRMVRNYLSKMQHYNLVEAEGATRGRTYQLVG